MQNEKDKQFLRRSAEIIPTTIIMMNYNNV